MICKVCKKNKPEEDFYFFQNPKGEPRRRHNCKECYNNRVLDRYYRKKGIVLQELQPPIIIEPVVPIEVTEGFKRCTLCKEVKPTTEFYHFRGYVQSRCKKCNNGRKKVDVWENLDYRTQPGEWISDEQRDVVHKILKKIGWSYNRSKDIWYKMDYTKKKIYKDKDGNWYNLKKNIPIEKPKDVRKRLELPIDKIMKLYNMGWTYKQLGVEFN